MASKFFFSLEKIKPQISNEAGSITYVTSKEASGFVNIAFSQLNLNKRGSLEPIWHPNASKIGYCTDGSFLVSLHTPSQVETFTVNKGDIFYIPKGYIHRIENIGEAKGIINFALNNSLPETMYLSKAVSSISDNVFNTTFTTPANYVAGLMKSKNNDLLKVLTESTPSNTNESEYKFNIEGSSKAVSTKGGYVQVGTKTTLPILEGLGILGFGLTPKGIVEPHWHTNAGELVYIVKGKTRITVLSPDGNMEVLEVKAGEGAFAPASHFHNIENIGSEEVGVIAFFTHDQPDYIGIGEVMGSYSNEVLASIFNTSADYFTDFNKPTGPLVIVPI